MIEERKNMDIFESFPILKKINFYDKSNENLILDKINPSQIFLKINRANNS